MKDYPAKKEAGLFISALLIAMFVMEIKPYVNDVAVKLIIYLCLFIFFYAFVQAAKKTIQFWKAKGLFENKK